MLCNYTNNIKVQGKIVLLASDTQGKNYYSANKHNRLLLENEGTFGSLLVTKLFWNVIQMICSVQMNHNFVIVSSNRKDPVVDFLR